MFMNPIISSVHANLCGDGCISEIKENRGIWDIRRYNRKKKNRTRYVIVYTNNSEELLIKFKKNIRFLFPNITFSNSRWNEVRIRNKNIVNFFYRFGEYGSRKWRIPNEIKYGTKKIKIAWIKSFFDDEATVYRRRIIIETVNKSGMKDLSFLLDSLKIENKLKKRRLAGLYGITVYNTRRYESLIGFDHKSKSQKLATFLRMQ